VADAREGVSFSSLDDELFEGAGVVKRQLVDYLDAVSDRMVPVLADRPLSVMRVTGGQAPFMQKNLPKYTPDWVARVDVWAEASRRTVSYGLCNDRRTLLWFANQRAIEYHPALVTASRLDHVTHLVIDLDPPEGSSFAAVVDVALLVKAALDGAGLAGALKTSGSKGVHVFVPIDDSVSIEDAAVATRALARRAELLDPSIATTAFVKDEREGKVFVDSTRAGGATVVSAWSPRIRPGLPVSFPLAWDDLSHDLSPRAFTVTSALALVGDSDPWLDAMPPAQPLPPDLVGEGHEIPVPRVAAMHEGKRRKRARAD
jgi:bifunctional non-homologous end joining protein LigD